MRRLVVNILALAIVLAGVGIGLGQQADQPTKRKIVRVEEEEKAKPKTTPAKSKLEEMLAEALKNNPDIRVAATKVAKADAELNRTRLQVTQKVVELYYAIDAQKKTVALQEERLSLFERGNKSGDINFASLLEARQAVTLAKAKLAELESQMPALLGKVTPREGNTYQFSFKPIESIAYDFGIDRTAPLHLQRATGPLADRIRKALQTPVTVDYKDRNLSEILGDLQKMAPGLSFRDAPGYLHFKITSLHFEEALPVSAILQALGDELQLTFFVREYGILAAPLKESPPGAITVQEFLRQKPEGK